MPLWSRIRNVFRGERLNREIDEELQSHLDEAVARGRDPMEAKRALGSTIRLREQSRDVRLVTWLDSLRSDLVFGWRQVRKTKTASAAAILSLGLAIGACTAAFRLIDAMLLRPLPVASPERLRVVTFEHMSHTGEVINSTSFDYPSFRSLRAAVRGSAEAMAISHASRIDLTYGSDNDMEKAYRQYVSGWTLGTLGLKPVAGRILTEADDITPGGHPLAVLSHDYWTRRFGQDPRAVGRTFRIGPDLYEIAGVLEKGFTGTDTGTMTDIFVPTMMNAAAINEPAMSWFRVWMQLRPEVNAELVRQKVEQSMRASRREAVKDWRAGIPQARIDHFLTARITLEPASAGVSWMQDTYRQSLWVLAALVSLVLLIACANVANLMSAQAAARAREMALRVSIGAGRLRLVQLVFAESTIIAFAATVVGGLIAWWAAPFVVGMINPPETPARLDLPADWRVLGFAAALALLVTVLFGLAPALRASAIRPSSALKGGEDPHSRRRLMHALVALQVAFCLLVHFVAGLFVSSFERMTDQPTGFSSVGVLVFDVGAKGAQPHAHWDQVLERLRGTAGVESAGLARWALLSGSGWNQDVWGNGQGPAQGVPNPYFHAISPGWLDTMRIPLLDGRDFRAGEKYPDVAIVNESFARRYFGGANPVGKSFEKMMGRAKRTRVTIVGFVPDARYSDMREPIRPTVYVPFVRVAEATGGDAIESPSRGTFVVRTATTADPLALASLLRAAIHETRPELRVSSTRLQSDIVRAHTLRERLLAVLSLFFAGVAMILAGVGLYGVLDYAVVQRRREIGIRLALGASASHIATRLTFEISCMISLGAAAGLTLGLVSETYITALLYQVKGTDTAILVTPVLTILAVALLAALPPIWRAIRIDPVATMRSE